MWFSDHPVTNYREAIDGVRRDRFRRWWQEMLARGVLFHPSQDENLFVSMAHDDEDVDRTLAAAAEAMPVVAAEP
jgi:glutamate-1-semialdehyde 2,1-aminomutase